MMCKWKMLTLSFVSLELTRAINLCREEGAVQSVCFRCLMDLFSILLEVKNGSAAESLVISWNVERRP